MQKINKAYRFKLQPSNSQQIFFSKCAGSCRFLYNWGLAKRKEIYEAKNQSLSYVEQARDLPELKNSYDWLKEVPSQSLQWSLRYLDQAFKNFFRRLKTGEVPGFPQFKKKFQHDSFKIPNQSSQISIIRTSNKNSKVKLPKIGFVKFRQSRLIEGKTLSVTISREADGWYISFCQEVDILVPQNLGSSVGLDRGIISNIKTSDDVEYNLPDIEIKKLEQRIAKLQNNNRRKKKGSNNIKKTYRKIARLHQRISRIRLDTLHKITTQLAKNHSLIVLEDLKIKNMSRSAKGTLENPGSNVKAKSGLNRSILRQSWGKIEQLLSYKCLWYGSFLQLVNPRNSSRECSKCGEVNVENRESQSKFVCKNPGCNHSENADTNAAKVILARGLRVLACGEAALAASLKQESPTINALAF